MKLLNVLQFALYFPGRGRKTRSSMKLLNVLQFALYPEGRPPRKGMGEIRMRRLMLSGIFLTLAICSIVGARTVDREPEVPVRYIAPIQTDHHIPELGIIPRVSAGYDTTFLASYSWDNGGTCDPQGWTPLDMTAQTHEFWHVAGATELDGGTFGQLVPLEGAQSLWCGVDGPVTAAADRVLCSYAVLPGYGNNWDQAYCLKDCLTGAGGVEVDVAVMWDSEPGYDATTLEADNCDENWVDVYGGLGTWDGVGTDTLAIAVSDTLHIGSLRLRFRFVSDGTWSDADGLWDTDGAFLLDQLTVRDTSGVRVATENFEDEAPGTHETDDWISCNIPGYGDFSGLYPGSSLVQEDPCASELDCVWAFFKGSTVNYACGGWPGQAAVPYRNERDQYIHNVVVSPEIPVVGSGSIWELRFDVYRDLQLDALVYYVPYLRSFDAVGCPGVWTNLPYNYISGGGKDWLRATWSIGRFVDPDATHIQVALGVRDMCGSWCGVYGTGACHSHAPLIDDCEVYRVDAQGPRWRGRDIDMFQDNFAEDGTLTGTARADMAQDILPATSSRIVPGDSARVDVWDPDVGVGFHVAGDTSSGAAVYCFVRADGPKAATPPQALIDDPRYHLVGSVSAGGRTWAQIRMDSTWNAGGGLVSDRYNIDLNDNLFVPGDTIWHFYGARNNNSFWTYWAIPVPTPTRETDDINEAAIHADEFTILPAAGYLRGGDILYVDGMNFRGSQPYFDTAFESLGILDLVDRYDIRGPSSGVGNHPGGRVKATSQLTSAYRRIVWTCGDLETVFADGSGWPDKSDDTGLLYEFLENHPGAGGVYLDGDDVPDKWLNVHRLPSSTQLRTKYIPFDVVSWGHVSTVGISPLVVGEAGGMFDDAGDPDTLVAYGGCPLLNDFDVITPQGTASLEMSYHGSGNTGGAIVSDTTTNPLGNTVGFILSGFSYHYIRDAHADGLPARTIHMERILNWLGDPVGPATDAAVVPLYTNSLAQNYPNPFNPATTIEYSIAEPGHVTLRVYNVAGQLVRTLVDEYQTPQEIQPVIWSGQNDRGQNVSTGVYFYKLSTRGFTRTRKMLLLK
jgi:hypothetical protein